MNPESVGTPLLWGGFTLFVLALLALDLGVFHRRPHAVHVREALLWTLFWITLALLFNAGVYFWFGSERALEFFTGYVIEKALSVDNIFVFLVIFSYFAVPAALQHRVLFWGVLSALVMRAAFIVVGAALLGKFHWLLYVFGAFLVFTGLKLLLQRAGELHPERNLLLRTFQRLVPTVSAWHGPKFTVVQGGRRYATVFFSSWWRSRPPTFSLRSTRSRQSSPSRAIPLSSTRQIFSPFSVCAPSTSPWRD
jgi:tellurite resistance protein TerC